MDKIEELIDNIETSLMGCGDEDVEYANRCAKELSVSRAALRAAFDAQTAKIAELEKEVHDVSVYLNKNHAPVVDWNLKPGYAAVELLKKFYSEKVELEAENAALKDAQRWIPVGERLPEEAQEIYAREYNGIFTHFKYSKRLYEIFIRHYTHWRPLPQPPEAE